MKETPVEAERAPPTKPVAQQPIQRNDERESDPEPIIEDAPSGQKSLQRQEPERVLQRTN